MRSVSVIIPTWNREKTLKRAIESALNQTLPPMEVMVCDDGSMDNTYKIVESLSNAKVKWLAGKHTGLPAVPRNRGIKNAKGEWLAFLDSDDSWLPNKLERQLDFAKKANCLAVCSNAFKVNGEGKKLEKYFNHEKEIIEFSDLLETNYIICSSAIIHKSLIFKCIGFPETPKLRTGQDYAFWLRVSTQTKFVYLKETLINYLDEPKKSIRRLTKSSYCQKIFILQNFLQWSLKNKVHFKYVLKAFFYYLKSVFNLLISTI